MICLPGAMGTAETDFAAQLEGLAPSLGVVAFDPRGYGKYLGVGEGHHPYLGSSVVGSTPIHGNPSPSILGGYNPYFKGLKPFIFHGFGVQRIGVQTLITYNYKPLQGL